MYLLSILLLVGGILFALAQIFAPPAQATTQKNIVARWWNELWNSPDRQGLVLLLLWQVAPLLLLTRHSIVLFVHYFIFFLPGQFILMAFCFTRIIALVRQLRPAWEKLACLAVPALAALVILAQLVGLGNAIVDIDAGHFQNPTFSDLSDQEHALQVAQQVAQQRHIGRIYLTASPIYVKVNAMDYLAQQRQMPLAFFTSESCFILPSPSAGPVIFITNGDDAVADFIFAYYANATLVATSPHLGSPPYRIFVVTAKPAPAPVPHAFTRTMQLLSPTAQLLQDRWLVTRWSVQDAHPPAFRTTYNFRVQVRSVVGPALSDTQNCTPTLTWAGDQVFAFHYVSPGTPFPSQLALQVSTSVAHPQVLRHGPFIGFTFRTENTTWQSVLTDDQKTSFTVPVVVNNT